MNNLDDRHTCEICGQYYKQIIIHVKNKHNLTEQQYYDQYFKQEDEGICPTCGKQTSFRNYRIGYRSHCSVKCSSSDPNVQAKNRKTNLEKYGVEHNWNNGILRENYKKTMLERYGVDHNWKSSDLRSKEKIKISPIEQYFIDWLESLDVDYEYRYYGQERYPYECDFYLPEYDYFIEINNIDLHDNHIFDPDNEKDVQKLEYIKSRAKTSSWFKSYARIWMKDREKYDTAMKNNLKYTILWTKKDIDDFCMNVINNTQSN